MKIKSIGIVFLWLGLFLMGCAAPSEVVPTQASVAEVPVEATAVSVPATATAQPQPTGTAVDGQLVNAEGITLVYDPSLASAVSGAVVPGFGGAPAIPEFIKEASHVLFTFEGVNSPNNYHQPRLRVYDLQDYTHLAPAAGEVVESLKTLLAERPSTVEQIPYLPFANAAQVFRSNVAYVEFSGGSGVRFVTYYAQDVSPVTNADIFYAFQGITADGNYYISAEFPLNTAVLPANYEAAAINDYEQFAANYQLYLDGVVAQLNGLTATDYTPNLNLLDDMIRSLSVPATVTLPRTEIPVLNPCDTIPPAAVVAQNNNFVNTISFLDATGVSLCDVQLQAEEEGNIAGIQAVAGTVYYVYNHWADLTASLWRLNPDGSQENLTFTTIDNSNYYPFHFIVSADGSQVVWSYVLPDQTESGDQVMMQVAGVDGSNLVTLLDQTPVENFVVPQLIRFTADGVYYALQPMWVDGTWEMVNGRYPNVYRIPVTGGQAELLFDCATINMQWCVGDVSANGQAIAYVDRAANLIRVIDTAGNEVGSFATPTADYVGHPLFSPSGTFLAFMTATVVVDEIAGLPTSKPGNIYFIGAPFRAEAGLLVQLDELSGIWNWLNDEQVVYLMSDPATGLYGFGVVDITGNHRPFAQLPYYLQAVGQ